MLRRLAPLALALAAALVGVALLRDRTTATASFAAEAYHTAAFGSGHSQTTKMAWPATDPWPSRRSSWATCRRRPGSSATSWVDGGCATWGKVILGNHSDAAFQLRVSAPAPSGGFDVAETERTFAGAARAALAAAGPSDALETHAALYADDLTRTRRASTAGGSPTKSCARRPPTAPPSPTRSSCPCRTRSSSSSSCPRTRPRRSRRPGPCRYSAALPPPGHLVGSKFRELPALTALAVSYATADVDAAVAFYRDVLGAETALDRAVGGSRVAMLRFPSDAPTRAVEVHYIAHGSPDWDVGALEDARIAAHAAALVSETSGFDQWMDGHIGHRLGRSNVLDGFLENARAAETPHVLFTDYASSSDSWTDASTSSPRAARRCSSSAT
ncbi:hypothetical protein JL722_11199 [Aureococcus anophagefferens]|nr:hypothetical protein JL722_11199 [Aureococcus anophagefferens]